MPSVALLGSRLLGEAIGRRLLAQGVELKVWNRTPERCQTLIADGAQAVPDLSSLAEGCSTVITVLRDAPVTQAVVRELGDLRGGCLMPMGTMGITEIRDLADQVQHQNGHCLEAPVLGSKPQALKGELLVMAGGESGLFDQQRPLLEHLSQEPMLVGPIGSGAATKLALNQLIASLTHAFSLSLRLVQQAGVPVETFMAILPTLGALCPHLRQEAAADARTVTTTTRTSAQLMLRKDLRLFLEEATAAGLQVGGLQGLDDPAGTVIR